MRLAEDDGMSIGGTGSAAKGRRQKAEGRREEKQEDDQNMGDDRQAI